MSTGRQLLHTPHLKKGEVKFIINVIPKTCELKKKLLLKNCILATRPIFRLTTCENNQIYSFCIHKASAMVAAQEETLECITTRAKCPFFKFNMHWQLNRNSFPDSSSLVHILSKFYHRRDTLLIYNLCWSIAISIIHNISFSFLISVFYSLSKVLFDKKKIVHDRTKPDSCSFFSFSV